MSQMSYECHPNVPVNIQAVHLLTLFEQDEIGPDLFTAACQLGLEGIVSKRAYRPYRAGRSKDWVKVKNRKHPAYRRVQEQF